MNVFVSSNLVFQFAPFNFDTHRPDSRVTALVKKMGSKTQDTQKRVLCLNKVDLVEDKKDLLKVAKQFQNLPGFDKYDLFFRFSLLFFFLDHGA